MLLEQLYSMYYNIRPKSAAKGGHYNVLSPLIKTLILVNEQQNKHQIYKFKKKKKKNVFYF